MFRRSSIQIENPPNQPFPHSSFSPRPWRGRHDRRGTLLLEALLSVTILSVSLVVIIQSFVTCYRAIRQASRTVHIDGLAENMLTDILIGHDPSAWEEGESDFGDPYTNYVYEIRHSPFDENEDLPVVRLDVMIRSEKDQKELKFQTSLFENETDEDERNFYE